MPLPPQPRSRSLWLAESGAESDADSGAAPQPVPARTDVVIIGAGVGGLATAAMLDDAGVSVVVIDARDVATGATGHSSAKVSVLHELTGARIARRRNDAVAGQYIQANRFGSEWIESRVVEDRIDCSWQKRTAVTYLTEQSSKLDLLRREAALLNEHGVTAELTDSVDLPYPVTAAIAVPGQAQFDPVAFVRGLAHTVADHGVSIVSGVRATGVDDSRSGGATVTTDHGSIEARHVVVTTGLPFLDRGLLFARTEPDCSYILACEVEADHPDGMFLSADGSKRSLRTAQTADGEVLLVGGENHKTGQGGDTEERYETLARWTDEHFGLRSVRFRFMTEDFMTPDHVPFAGPINSLSKSVLVATGMNKWGFTNSVASAAVNAAIVLDAAAPSWAQAYSTTRLPLAGFDQLVKANADVAVHMVGGWASALTSRADEPPAAGEGHTARTGLDVVAVSTTEDDGPCRVSGVCPHLGGILAWNPAEETWDCPLHGSRFERDGRMLHGPAVDDLAEHD